jgi:hypothetical protein
MDYWRDCDLRERKRKLQKAFRREKISSVEEFPVLVHTGNYYAFGGKPRPLAYWEDPAFMLKYQQDYFAEHILHVNDDLIPYFCPWFGCGVLATAFGVGEKPAIGNGDDPFVTGPIVNSALDAAKLKMPDPMRDGLMPKVLRFMDYAREYGDLPVGPTDLNSPLSTLAQICGYENLFVWMYEDPKMVHEMMDLVTEAFINWVKIQKEHAGEPLDASNGLQGVWSPKGVGVWVSDDDLVSISPDMYEEFVVPYYRKVFAEFSGGHLHYCGAGTQHLENFKKIGNLKVINNSVLGNADAFAALAAQRPEGTVIQIQDGVTADPESYFRHILKDVTDLSGMMVVAFVWDTMRLKNNGTYEFGEWDRLETANSVVAAVRKVVSEKLEKTV